MPAPMYTPSNRSSKRRAAMRTAMLLVTAAWLTAPRSVAEDQPWRLEVFHLPTEASCRSILVDHRGEIWVGGTAATLLHSADQGKSWHTLETGAPAASDFRDVAEPAAGTLLVMSAGPGPVSRLLRSADSGRSWNVVLENPDESGFFNGMAFSSDGFGVLVGDPVEGRLTVFTSDDAGQSWQRDEGPRVDPGEYGFAASGTGLLVAGDRTIGILTGGSRCRFFSRAAGSAQWSSADTGIRCGAESSGGFSVAMQGQHGVAIGGDYQQPQLSAKNVAITRDGGQSWVVPDVAMPHKACVAGLGGNRFIACGRTGIAVTADGGRHWRELNRESFYALTVAPTHDTRAGGQRTIWLTGAEGRVARLHLDIDGL